MTQPEHVAAARALGGLGGPCRRHQDRAALDAGGAVMVSPAAGSASTEAVAVSVQRHQGAERGAVRGAGQAVSPGRTCAIGSGSLPPPRRARTTLGGVTVPIATCELADPNGPAALGSLDGQPLSVRAVSDSDRDTERRSVMAKLTAHLDARFTPAQMAGLELIAARFDVSTSEALRMCTTAALSSVPWVVDALEEAGTPIVHQDPIDYLASKVRAGEAAIA